MTAGQFELKRKKVLRKQSDSVAEEDSWSNVMEPEWAKYRERKQTTKGEMPEGEAHGLMVEDLIDENVVLSDGESENQEFVRAVTPPLRIYKRGTKMPRKIRKESDVDRPKAPKKSEPHAISRIAGNEEETFQDIRKTLDFGTSSLPNFPPPSTIAGVHNKTPGEELERMLSQQRKIPREGSNDHIFGDPNRAGFSKHELRKAARAGENVSLAKPQPSNVSTSSNPFTKFVAGMEQDIATPAPGARMSRGSWPKQSSDFATPSMGGGKRKTVMIGTAKPTGPDGKLLMAGATRASIHSNYMKKFLDNRYSKTLGNKDKPAAGSLGADATQEISGQQRGRISQV